MMPPLGSVNTTGRILIVDDERHNRHLLEVMLEAEGFALISASSGPEALALVAAQSPDLILLDIMMPGMDGYQVAEALKGSAATTHIPIIMITALDNRDARVLGLSAGAEDFLTKPFDRAELCLRVRNLLRLKAYGDHYGKYSQVLEGEVVARTTDLTDQRNRLEQQAVVLTKQAALLDLAQDAIYVRDMSGRILFWSHGAELLYGWPSGETVGADITEVLKAEFFDADDEREASLLRDGRWEGEAMQQRRDGTRLTVATRWALQRDVDGTPVRVLTINSDISDRKRAEAESLLLTERLSLATVVAGVGVWEWHLASNTLSWDATMFDIYGMPVVASVPYEQWSASVHPDDLGPVEEVLRKAIREKGEGSAEFRIVHADGSVRTVLAVERVVVDSRGEVARVIGVNKDITVRKAAEQTLERSRQEQMRFKDEFLSHVSHELRSPLTAIKQFTTILIGGLAGALNPEQLQYQQIVLKNIHQLQAMIDDLLEVTRLETGKLTLELEQVSIQDAIADAVNTLRGSASAKEIAITTRFAPGLPSAHADPTRLRQILIILLDNAVKFTPAGGSIEITAGMTAEPGTMRLEVCDTGCGISPEITSRVFERLYQVSTPTTASREGLGLGLFICHELVTRQGGQISAAAGPEKGTIVSFTIPVFSLNTLIAPLFKSNRWPSSSVALVTVVFEFPGVPQAAPKPDIALEARAFVQRCLLPDLDVLLPSRGPRLHGERLFVAVFADERGVSVLCNRIREQFTGHRLLTQAQARMSVAFTMLPPFAQDDGTPSETAVDSMARMLDQAIASTLSHLEAT